MEIHWQWRIYELWVKEYNIIELFRYFHTFREAELNPGGGGGGDLGGNFEHAKIHRIDQILKGTPFVFWKLWLAQIIIYLLLGGP